MKIDWALYDPGLEDGSVTVNDVVREEGCSLGAVYNHCRAVGIRLQGKGKRIKKKGSYLTEITEGIKRHGSIEAVIEYMEKYGEY